MDRSFFAYMLNHWNSINSVKKIPNSDGIKIALFHAVTVCKQVCVCVRVHIKFYANLHLNRSMEIRANQLASQSASEVFELNPVSQAVSLFCDHWRGLIPSNQFRYENCKPTTVCVVYIYYCSDETGLPRYGKHTNISSSSNGNGKRTHRMQTFFNSYL